MEAQDASSGPQGQRTRSAALHRSFPCSAWECNPWRSASHSEAERGASLAAFPRRAWGTITAW